MAGDKTRKLELKKVKKMRKGSSSFTPPPDWIKGDWLPSTVTEETVRRLVAEGLMPKEGWRLPAAGKLEPVPNQDEREIQNLHSLVPPPDNDPTDEKSESGTSQRVPSEHEEGEDEESEDKSDEDDEDESEDEVEYLPSADAVQGDRTKRNQDPSGVTPTTRATKRARVEAEQQASPPPSKGKGSVKVITQKPRKAAALPRVRKPMPVVAKVVPSASFTSQATGNTTNRSMGTLDADDVSSKAAEEVNPAIELDSGAEQARNSEEIPSSLRQGPIAMDTAPDKSPSSPEIQPCESIQTPTAPEPIMPSTLAVTSPHRNLTPSIPSTSFSLARSPEDEVGVGKEAMLQAEQMETQLKELLRSNETMKTNIRKTCELGTKYLDLQKELEKVRQELDEEQAKTIRLEKEKTTVEESVKKILEEKGTDLAKAWEEADAKTKKADDRLEELREVREMNDHYLKAAEDTKKQIKALKASESEWHTKYLKMSDLAETTKMKYEKDLGELKQGMADTETFLVGQLDEVNQRLEVFCLDPITEAHKVQKELEAYGMDIKETPWASTRVAEAVIRLEERAKAAKSVIAQVMKSMKGINATLRPGEEVDETLPVCLQQLEQVSGQVSSWKKSAAPCGANVPLALTRVHFPKINEAKLQNIGVGNPEGNNFEDHMKTFIETASQIASFIDLDLFVQPAGVPDTSKDEPVQEEEKNK